MVFEQLHIVRSAMVLSAEQRHRAALTADILNCIEDCIAVTNRVVNDLHCNIWSDLIDTYLLPRRSIILHWIF